MARHAAGRGQDPSSYAAPPPFTGAPATRGAAGTPPPIEEPAPDGPLLPAALSGAYLGSGRRGPFVMRLLRPTPTRVLVFSGGFAAQLLTLRSALSGVPVRVLSARSSAWAPVLQHGADARLLPGETSLAGHSGPLVVVDDLAEQRRAVREVGAWQCLLDVRTLPHAAGRDLALAFVQAFASADVAVFGVLNHDLAGAAARVWGLDERTTSELSAGLPAQAVAVVTRGKAAVVRVDATPTEAQVLRSAVLHSGAR
ncbi:hypothetical protein [Nocardioides litoris]|uniref:hypothetical protein n=1 Tax=Nocardioides litoris TaxID=1926648 RepID=UPI00111F7F02|nr:hypothetical protein [Nocardioides litoris]